MEKEKDLLTTVTTIAAITAPDGYEVDKENSLFEGDKCIIKFKLKENPLDKLPKKFEDLKSIDGFHLTENSNIKKSENLHADNTDRNVSPYEELCEALLAKCQLEQLLLRYPSARDITNDDKVYYINLAYIFKFTWLAGPNHFYGTTVYFPSYIFKSIEERDHFFKYHIDLLNKSIPLYIKLIK